MLRVAASANLSCGCSRRVEQETYAREQLMRKLETGDRTKEEIHVRGLRRRRCVLVPRVLTVLVAMRMCVDYELFAEAAGGDQGGASARDQ